MQLQGIALDQGGRWQIAHDLEFGRQGQHAAEERHRFVDQFIRRTVLADRHALEKLRMRCTMPPALSASLAMSRLALTSSSGV